MSTTLSAIRMREMRISSDETRAIQAITTMLVLLVSRPHAEGRAPAFDRRALWRFGISGDRPLIVVEAAAVRGIGLVRSLARALRLWSWGDVACDLVVLDSEPSSYEMPLQRELTAIREQYVRDVPSGPSQLHVVAATTLTPDERAAFAVLPRLRLFADGRSLAEHVQDHLQWHGDALARRTEQSVARPLAPAKTRIR
jgi:cyclic beta-1,2-glucan synthetase